MEDFVCEQSSFFSFVTSSIVRRSTHDDIPHGAREKIISNEANEGKGGYWVALQLLFCSDMGHKAI